VVLNQAEVTPLGMKVVPRKCPVS